MPSYRRRLPHLHQPNEPIFLTWCLAGSLPSNRHFSRDTITSAKSFATFDRLLDNAQTGPFYLRQPAIAEMLIHHLHSETVHHQCTLHAFVVMPNHVHLLATPNIPLPKFTQLIKGCTARLANQVLGSTGTTFWQQETYDHQVRDSTAFKRIHNYIEQNPVKAGLATNPSNYKYSSAYEPDVPVKPSL